MNARAPDSTKSAAAGLGARNRPVATNIPAALTGSASGGMTIALDALGETCMRIAVGQGIHPALMHRVAAIGFGTLDSLPHNGAVVTLLAPLWLDASRKLSRYRHGRDCQRAHRP